MGLYVIGPVSGIKDGNRAEFEAARAALEAAGYRASIPHDFIDPETDWQTAMRVSISRMLLVGTLAWDLESGELVLHGDDPVFGGVAELPGTMASRGARCERGICEQLGIPHRPVAEWVADPAPATPART